MSRMEIRLQENVKSAERFIVLPVQLTTLETAGLYVLIVMNILNYPRII